MPLPVLNHINKLKLLHAGLWVQAVASALPAAEQTALRMQMTRSLLDALAAGERDPETLRQVALKEIGHTA